MLPFPPSVVGRISFTKLYYLHLSGRNIITPNFFFFEIEFGEYLNVFHIIAHEKYSP